MRGRDKRAGFGSLLAVCLMVSGAPCWSAPAPDPEETDESYTPPAEPEAPTPKEEESDILPRDVNLSEQARLSLEQARNAQLYREQQKVAASLDTAPPSENAENCFSKMGLQPDVAIAIVQLVQHLPHNKITTGTGFIVADSADSGTPYNRILTARHVLSESYRTSVILSDGTLIGSATPISLTHRSVIKDDDGSLVGQNDLAVLELTNFMPGQQDRYRDIKGLPLAHVRPTSLLSGVMSSPGGIERGASGSPVLTEKNEVVGVVTQSFINDAIGAPRVRATGWNGVWDSNKREFLYHKETVSLPDKARVIADTITSQEILYSLGMSGISYTNGRFSGPVVVAGYPQRTCLVYRSTFKSK